RNRGDSWFSDSSSLNGNPIIVLAGPVNGVGKIYAATVPADGQRAEIFKLDAATGGWNNVTHDLPDRFITGIELYPRNKDIAFVTLSGFSSSHLFVTTDAAETWTDIGQGLPDLPTHDVLVDKEDQKNIYVANDLGVYVSTDFGETWNDFNEGLPTAVMAMDLSMSELNRKIRIATHGNGVWQRTMLPANPDPDTDPDDNVPVEYELVGNYPNPFNPETKIEIKLEQAVYVELKIYNVSGQEVRSLANRTFEEGLHYIIWDGTNNRGKAVGSGVYIYTMKAGGQYKAKKMTLIR
ncbi:MAG: T9SS type A sorting domain-containing protein, partial [bacterium]|nr:T9SS type A sorting domain-containing protein [bacterium]